MTIPPNNVNNYTPTPTIQRLNTTVQTTDNSKPPATPIKSKPVASRISQPQLDALQIKTQEVQKKIMQEQLEQPNS